MKLLFAGVLASALTVFGQDDGKLTIDVPASVQSVIAKERGDTGKIVDFRRVNETDGTTFVIGILLEGKRYSLSLDAGGRVMRKSLDTEDQGPKQVALDALPANVRKTVQRESAGSKIGDIEVQEAKTRYSTEFLVGNRKYRLEVDADGTLLSKEYVGDREE